jgi:hypothetical protein
LICILLPAPPDELKIVAMARSVCSDANLPLDVCSTVTRVPVMDTVTDAAIAASAAAVLSGAPSTSHALLTGANPLEASLAAGTLLLPHEERASRLLPAALLAHAALSLGWALVLAAILPRRRTVAWSLLAGLAIAALDLGVVGRRYPRIRALPLAPQVLDHLAYGATVGWMLSRRRARRSP